MTTAREAATAGISQSVAQKAERAFWELDDVMVALSPDAPQHVADAWSALYKGMTTEFIAERDRLRGLVAT